MHELAINTLQDSTLLAVTVQAQEFAFGWLTNSILVAAIVVGLLTLLAQAAMRRPKLIPSGLQNGFEFLVEFLYKQLEEVLGPKVAPRAFPLLATIFIFVVFANWLGLFPGVGTIGWGASTGPMTVNYVDRPLIRPATADVNMTLGIGIAFMVVWLYLTVSELGVKDRGL